MNVYFETYWFVTLLLFICIIFAVYAEVRVKTTFNTYSKMFSKKGLTANQVARIILDSANLNHIKVVAVGGNLTDYYDSKNNVIALSSSVFDKASVSAISVATHEVGHAIQNKNKYLFANLRRVLIPVCNFGSLLVWPIIILGILINYISAYTSNTGNVFLFIGIGIFGLSTLISLITVPLERDASNRAISILKETNILDGDELVAAKKVLNSASLTYVAGLLVSVLNFLRILILFLPRNRN